MSRNNGVVKVLGIITVVAGAVFVIAGAVTWGAVSSNLAAEKITVSPDAAHFGNQAVNSPWTAWYQADAIKHHSLKASNGLTYAELGTAITAKQNDLKNQGMSADDIAKNTDVVALTSQRNTVMTGSFLRSSLFTSVIAFGVAFFAFGVGVVSLLVGWALIRASAPVVVAAPAAPPTTVNTAV
ncbi:MAG TPA: aromatic ring-opening dioxygenase LigA [Cellulomonas sp.]